MLKQWLLKAGAAALIGAIAAMPAHAVTVNFDVDANGAAIADGTAIDTLYSAYGVTFGNPLGGTSIYARTTTLNDSAPNVASVFQTGVPAFDARFGAVQASFATGQNFVSIDAAILRLPEGLGSPVNSPRLEIFNTSGAFVTAVLWNFGLDPQPGAGGFAGWQTLSYTSAGADIGSVRFLSGQPGGSPSNFGLFDNLSFGQPTVSAPEPGVLGLAGLGIVLLGVWRRRSASAQV